MITGRVVSVLKSWNITTTFLKKILQEYFILLAIIIILLEPCATKTHFVVFYVGILLENSHMDTFGLFLCAGLYSNQWLLIMTAKVISVSFILYIVSK